MMPEIVVNSAWTNGVIVHTGIEHFGIQFAVGANIDGGDKSGRCPERAAATFLSQNDAASADNLVSRNDCNCAGSEPGVERHSSQNGISDKVVRQSEITSGAI